MNETEIDWSKPNVMQSNEEMDWSRPDESKGWSGIGRDIKALPGKAVEGLKHLGTTIGEEAPYFAENVQSDLSRVPRTHLAGLAKSAGSILNWPGEARDYLAKKEVIPEGTPSFRLPQEHFPQIDETVLYDLLGLGQKKKGDVLGELIPDLLGGGYGATKAIGAIPKVAKESGKLARVGAAKVPEILKKGTELAGKGVEQITPKIAHAGIEKVKKGYEAVTAKTKQVEGIEANERLTKQQIHDLKKQIPESQIERAGDIEKIIEAEKTKRSATSKGVNPYLANEKEKKISNLTKSLTEAKEKITKPLKEEWKEFGNSEAMYKGVLEPIEIKSFNKEFGNPKEYASEGLQKIINKTIGTTEHIPEHIDIVHGHRTAKEVHHQKQPLIKDYLDLYRNAREEAADWVRESKNPDRLPDQQKIAGAKAKSLRKLAVDARKKLEGYLEGDELKKLKELEHRFEHEEIPWRESGLLRNATERHAKVGTENFSEALVNENYPHLRRLLLNEHPGAREAMAHYDLRGFDISDPKKIHKLLGSDEGRALPQKLQTDLREMATSVESEKELVKLRQSLTRGEVINQIHSKELKGILNKHPSLAEPFLSDIDRRTKVRKLENHLKDLGLSKTEIEANISTFEKTLGYVKKGAGLIPGAGAAAKLAGLLMP